MESRKLILLGIVIYSLVNLSKSQFWEGFQFARATIRPNKGRIIGGDEVEPHSIPFQVGLKINGNAFCSGSLITTNFVLTAAHCAEDIRTVEIVLGAHNITDDDEATRTTIAGSEVIIHDGYDNEIYINDIALIKLQTSANLSDFIQLATLPTSADVNKTYEGQTVVASGWGMFKDVPYPSLADLSPVLKSLEVVVDDLQDCMDYYYDPAENVNYITANNVCTSGYKARGTCNGDSGGPLTLTGILVGLTSFGTTMCEACSPSVYTRTANYLDWISANSDYIG